MTPLPAYRPAAGGAVGAAPTGAAPTGLPVYRSVSGITPGSPAGLPAYKSASEVEHDNGIPNPFGLLGNAWREGGQMVEGITHLVGAGVHDIAQGVKVALPGEQYGESEGFKLDDIAMALPKALAQDYGSRYGINKFSEGDFWGGLSDLWHGIYEHPLSFAGDILMVGGAAKLAAKAGVLGETAGASVLGHAPGAARGALEGVSLTAGKPLALTLSENPVTRLLQTKTYKLAQYGERLGTAKGYIGQLTDIGQVNTGKIGLALAEDAGLPVWRPLFSKAIEGRGVSKAFSLMGIRQKDAWIPEAQRMQRILDDARDELEPEYWKDGAADDLMGIYHGTDGALDAPPNTAAVNFSPDPDLELQVGDAIIPASAAEFTVWQKFSRTFGKKYGQEGGYVRVETTNNTIPHYAPHDTTGANASKAIFFTDDMSDAGEFARRIAEAADGEIAWVKNYFRDSASSYDGYHFGLRTKGADGADVITDVSIATRDLASSQQMWGHLAVKADVLDKEVSALRTKLSNLSPDVDPTDVVRDWERLVGVSDELEATRALNANTFDFTRRTLNGGPYDTLLAVADRTRPVVFNAATWKEMQRGVLTARRAMDRAFGPIRITKWSAMMKAMELEIGDVIGGAAAAGAKGEDIISAVYQAAERHLGRGHHVIEDIFRTQVDWDIPFQTTDNLGGVLRTGEKTIAGDNSWLPRGWRDNPAGAAQRIVDDIRSRTHEQFVINGESTGFTWKELLGEQHGLPTPQYYPHIRAPLASADLVWTPTRSTRVIDSITPREKKWGGWLYETGRYQKDPVRAYTSLFREVARHEEFANMMTSLVAKYGRQISEDELSLHAAKMGGAEVLISKNGLTNFVSARSKLMTLTHEGIMAGDDLGTATAKALQTLLDQAVSDFTIAGRMVDEVWAIPTHVAKHIDRAAKLSFGNTFNFYYDSAMNMWKASVLSMSPRWVVNNTLGNITYMAVNAPKAIKYAMSQMLPRRRALMRSILGNDFSGQLERDFVHGTLGGTESRLLARSQDAGVGWGQRLATWETDVARRAVPTTRKARLAVTGTEAIRGTSSGIRRLNAWIEDAARRGVALDSLRTQMMFGWESRFWSSKKLLQKISERGIPSSSEWDTTINAVNRVLGDYLVMSPVEQQIIRRYMMPFYAFYRHTAKFLARMPFEHPMKSRILQQITEIDRQMEGNMPDYMRGAAQIMPGAWLNFARANPMQAITTGYLPATAHPLMSLAIQRLTGTNPFGEPYNPSAEDHIFETSSGTQFAVKYGPNGEYLGVQELSGQWEPPLYQAIGSLVPQFALLPGVDVFGRDFARKVAGLAGVPYSNFNVDQYQYFAMRDQLEAYGRGASNYVRYPE